ncbi:hypothetical protein J2I47_21210 [Fibrella sp. HMF5335]|uniref:HEPN domain-containing protein n=1 Tax=Fibrella rubiginis TaxID=2817060 RepID=A0A939GH67_9BACT|nr:hypothetical protein [Fibrella rubiginis]MBO0939087.1 hypothetical protein [Fibrella rubiginis]
MENRKLKTLSLSARQGQLVISYFINGYADYLGARTLLVNGLLLQGAVLANTSIEKYFKGMLTAVNVPVPRRHDISTKKYGNTIKSHYRRLYSLINWEFIKFTSEAYRTRYLDDLKAGYSIAIVRLKTLAELDFTICSIEESFRVGDTDKPNRYRADIASNELLLHNLNYYLLKHDKTHFIEQLDNVIQFGIIEPNISFQLNYLTKDVKNDGKFLYKGVSSSESDLL